VDFAGVAVIERDSDHESKEGQEEEYEDQENLDEEHEQEVQEDGHKDEDDGKEPPMISQEEMVIHQWMM
jgi:hypothetical protein